MDVPSGKRPIVRLDLEPLTAIVVDNGQLLELEGFTGLSGREAVAKAIQGYLKLMRWVHLNEPEVANADGNSTL